MANSVFCSKQTVPDVAADEHEPTASLAIQRLVAYERKSFPPSLVDIAAKS